MLKIFAVVLWYFIKQASTDCDAENSYPWSYHGSENGPDNWGDSYPDCKQTNQSPIDITERNTVKAHIPKLQYTDFDKPITKAHVENLGWTVGIKPEDDVERTVNWGGLTYTLKSIHFHFGESEQEIEGNQYPMEIHFYTQNEDNKESAIFAVLSDDYSDNNPAYDPITNLLEDVKYKGDSTELSSDLTLSDLFPEDSGCYYYYSGSNSIPPCDPGFIWVVLKDIGKIGSDQMKTFMSLYSVGKDDANDDCLMGPNSRPTQAIGYRVIITNK